MATYKNTSNTRKNQGYQSARPSSAYNWTPGSSGSAAAKKIANDIAVKQNYRKPYYETPATPSWTPQKTAEAASLLRTTPGASTVSTAPTWTPQQYNYQPIDYGTQPTYSRSQELEDLYNQLKDYENQKPAEYKGSYDDQIKALVGKIENREKFAYDAADDPMYQVYKDQYQQSGKLAMQDSMGNAAALTGGYGSSYGQQVGQQTYQQHMTELNAKIPELAANAYSQYQAEGAQMFDQLGMYQNLDAADYQKYTGQVDQYYQQLGYYMNKYGMMSNEELTRYQQELAAWQSNRDFAYAQQQAAIEQNNWQQQFAYQQAQDAQEQSNWEKQFALSKSKASSSSSAKRSAAFSDIASTLKNLDQETGADYINSAVRSGYLSEDEGIYMGRIYLPALENSDQEMIGEQDALTKVMREYAIYSATEQSDGKKQALSKIAEMYKDGRIDETVRAWLINQVKETDQKNTRSYK